MSAAKAPTNTTKGRYTAIILSVVVFLLLTSNILITSIYQSLKILDLRAAVDLSTNLRSDIQTLTKDIYLLNTMQDKQIDTAIQQSQQQKIVTLTQEIDQKITTLNEGGNVTIGGDVVTYDALEKPEEQQLVQQTVELWQPYRQQTLAFIDKGESIPITVLQESFDAPTDGIYDNVTTLTNALNSENGRRAALLRKIQTFGISFAIIYFLIFVLYFVRRLKRSDEALIISRQKHQNMIDKYESNT